MARSNSTEMREYQEFCTPILVPCFQPVSRCRRADYRGNTPSEILGAGAGSDHDSWLSRDVDGQAIAPARVRRPRRQFPRRHGASPLKPLLSPEYTGKFSRNPNSHHEPIRRIRMRSGSITLKQPPQSSRDSN